MMNDSPLKKKVLYCGMFYFETKSDEIGTFSIMTNAVNIFAAENIFRKHIREWIQQRAALQPGTRIYILDIIEALHVDQPVIFQFTKEHSEHRNVFFSALPFPQPHVKNHTISIPLDKEHFLTVE